MTTETDRLMANYKRDHSDIVQRLSAMPEYCCSVPRLEARNEIMRLRQQNAALLTALEDISTRVNMENARQLARAAINANKKTGPFEPAKSGGTC